MCFYYKQWCSASLSADRLFFTPDNGSYAFNLDAFEENSQWIIVSTDVISGIRLGGSYLKFYMTIQRKPQYYLLNIVAPTILLSLMSLAVFWLPTHADEKMGLSVTILLAFTVFLLTIFIVLPTSSDENSLLSESTV